MARIPLLVWGLDLFQYGLYSAILGVVATANLLDLGLHYCVINEVAAARGRNDKEAIRSVLSTALIIYVVIAVLALSVAVPVSLAIRIDWLLGVGAEHAALARKVVLLAFCGIALPLPLKVYAAALTGYQKQYLLSSFNSVSSVVQLGLLALAAVLFYGDLVSIVASVVAGGVAHSILLSRFATARHPELALSIWAFSTALIPRLVTKGSGFLLGGLANVFRFSLGSTIIAHHLGPATVPQFSVPLALFMAANQLVGLVGLSLWPAYGEAASSGDWKWVHRAFGVAVLVSLGFSGLFAVLGFEFGGVVLQLAMPKALGVSPPVTALLAIWLVMQAMSGVGLTLLAGLNHVGVVTWIAVVEGALVFTLSVSLVGEYGVAGVAAGLALPACLSGLTTVVFVVPRLTKQAQGWHATSILRFVTSMFLAGLLSVQLRSYLAEASPWKTLAVGATLTAFTYVCLVWCVGLGQREREWVKTSLKAWLKQRFAS